MPFTLEDFDRWYIKEHFPKLTPEERRQVLESLPLEERREVLKSMLLAERREILESLPLEERREVLKSLPLEVRLAGLSVEEIRKYLDKLTANCPERPCKRGRKK